MGEILLDSNVVIAYLEPENDNHLVATRALLESTNTYYLTSISIAECLIITFRAGYEFAIESFWKIRELITLVISYTEHLAIQTARIGAEKNLKLADAAILATADAYSIKLWTFDRRLANKSPNIRYLLEE